MFYSEFLRKTQKYLELNKYENNFKNSIPKEFIENDFLELEKEIEQFEKGLEKKGIELLELENDSKKYNFRKLEQAEILECKRTFEKEIILRRAIEEESSKFNLKFEKILDSIYKELEILDLTYAEKYTKLCYHKYDKIFDNLDKLVEEHNKKRKNGIDYQFKNSDYDEYNKSDFVTDKETYEKIRKPIEIIHNKIEDLSDKVYRITQPELYSNNKNIDEMESGFNIKQIPVANTTNDMSESSLPEVIFEGNIDEWKLTKDDKVFVQEGEKIFNQDGKIIYVRKDISYRKEIDWKLSEDCKVFIFENNKIFNQNGELIFETKEKIRNWDISPNGNVFIHVGSKIFNEYGEVVYKGKGRINWKISTNNKIFVQEGENTIVCNGEIIYSSKEKIRNWKLSKSDLVFLQQGENILNQEGKILYSGKEIYNWKISQDNKVFIREIGIYDDKGFQELILNNNGELIYKPRHGGIWGWNLSYDNKVFVCERGNLFNQIGEVIYEGKGPEGANLDWKVSSNNKIYIKEGQKIFDIDGKVIYEGKEIRRWKLSADRKCYICDEIEKIFNKDGKIIYKVMYLNDWSLYISGLWVYEGYKLFDDCGKVINEGKKEGRFLFRKLTSNGQFYALKDEKKLDKDVIDIGPWIDWKLLKNDLIFTWDKDYKLINQERELIYKGKDKEGTIHFDLSPDGKIFIFKGINILNQDGKVIFDGDKDLNALWWEDWKISSNNKIYIQTTDRILNQDGEVIYKGKTYIQNFKLTKEGKVFVCENDNRVYNQDGVLIYKGKIEEGRRLDWELSSDGIVFVCKDKNKIVNQLGEIIYEGENIRYWLISTDNEIMIQERYKIFNQNRKLLFQGKSIKEWKLSSKNEIFVLGGNKIYNQQGEMLFESKNITEWKISHNGKIFFEINGRILNQEGQLIYIKEKIGCVFEWELLNEDTIIVNDDCNIIKIIV